MKKLILILLLLVGGLQASTDWLVRTYSPAIGGYKKYLKIKKLFLYLEHGGKPPKVNRCSCTGARGYFQFTQREVDYLLKKYKGNRLLRGINRWNWKWSVIRQERLFLMELIDIRRAMKEFHIAEIPDSYWLMHNLGKTGGIMTMKIATSQMYASRLKAKRRGVYLKITRNVELNLPKRMRWRLWNKVVTIKSTRGSRYLRNLKNRQIWEYRRRLHLMYVSYWVKKIQRVQKKLKIRGGIYEDIKTTHTNISDEFRVII